MTPFVILKNENNTHFYSIRSKVALHRAELIPALFNPTRYYDFQDEVTQELLMVGVLRVVTDEQLADNPLLAQGPAIFEVTEADKVLRVYLVGIAV